MAGAEPLGVCKFFRASSVCSRLRSMPKRKTHGSRSKACAKEQMGTPSQVVPHRFGSGSTIPITPSPCARASAKAAATPSSSPTIQTPVSLPRAAATVGASTARTCRTRSAASAAAARSGKARLSKYVVCAPSRDGSSEFIVVSVGSNRLAPREHDQTAAEFPEGNSRIQYALTAAQWGLQGGQAGGNRRHSPWGQRASSSRTQSNFYSPP